MLSSTDVHDEQSPLLPAPRRPPTLRHELRVILQYTLPIFGYVIPPPQFPADSDMLFFPSPRSHLLEYSLALSSVISIGHISTTALAASALGTMTAGVTAFSIIQGAASALDTLLPSAWTSSQPELVGVWSQRMGVVMVILMVVRWAIGL